MPQLISQQAAPAMQELKVGVIGGGFMARTHADAIRRAGAQLIGVRSNGEQSTARAAAVLGVPGFGSVEELLEQCDAVHVTSPNALHAGQAAAALAAGLSVVCESRWPPAPGTPASWPCWLPVPTPWRRCRSSTATTRWCARPAPMCAKASWEGC